MTKGECKEKTKCRYCGKVVRRWTKNKSKDWKSRPACRSCYVDNLRYGWIKAQHYSFKK